MTTVENLQRSQGSTADHLTGERLLRRRAVIERTGLSCPSIYRKMAAGEFPRPVRLSRQAVAWIEREIDAWIADRIRGPRAGRKVA